VIVSFLDMDRFRIRILYVLRSSVKHAARTRGVCPALRGESLGTTPRLRSNSRAQHVRGVAMTPARDTDRLRRGWEAPWRKNALRGDWRQSSAPMLPDIRG
jgi:hypothetical protein